MKSNKYIDKVQGPVVPLPTPFTDSDEVDYDSLRDYVNFLVDHGIPNVMTTVGTSRFNLLVEDEILKVNETVVEAAGDKAITIVANPLTGGTKHAIEFAKHAEKIGADLFLAYFPERHYGEENTYRFFKKLAESVSIGILIHEMPKRNGLGPGSVHYSMNLLQRLFEIENIVGLKEEALDPEYSNEILDRFGKDEVIIGAGGGMSRYLYRDFERGAKAFLSGIGNFYPELELEFFQSITSGNMEKAKEIVEKKELPFFAKTVPVGWHPSLKAVLALKNLMPAHEREPMKDISKEELDVLSGALKDAGWL